MQKKTQKRHLIILMTLFIALLGGTSSAWAVNWSGSIGNTTYSSNTNVYLTGTVTLTGKISITGGTTKIYASSANRTIKRGTSNTGILFEVSNGATLIFYGTNSSSYPYKITIDGQSVSNARSAIFINAGGTVTMTDVTMQNNTTKTTSTNDATSSAGAIYTKGTLNCTNCVFTNNKAYYGGAVCVYNGGNATITGGSFTKNEAAARGGAICVTNASVHSSGDVVSGNATLTLSGVTIGGSSSNGNKATGGYGFGGGVYVRLPRASATIKDNTVISYNLSYYGGNGICIADKGSVTLNACDIHHNSVYNGSTSGIGGGGIALGGTTDGAATLTVNTGCKIRDNSSWRGGGISMAEKQLGLTVAGGAIYNNTSSGNGGGVSMTGANQTFSMTSGSIYGNTAATNGGGVFMSSSNGSFSMSGGQFYGNTATDGYGGGVYLAAGCTFNMTGGSLGVVGQAKNSAKRGGGIYDLGTFTMNGSSATIANNEATTNEGGGAYISTSSATSLKNGSVVSNTSKTNGAGLYITGGSVVTSNGVSISSNIAEGNGGGVYITSTAGNSFTMQNGSISSNEAKAGGGVYDNASFSMTGGNIDNNIANNGAGGGVYVNTTNATSLSGGIISGNTCTSYGGGVYITGGSAVTANGVSVYGNTADERGGGVYLSSSAGNSFTMSGGTIGQSGSPNKAGFGGGICSYASFTMTGGSIVYNESTSTNGGGAYISYNGVTTLSGTISNNTAKTNGGGIFLNNGTVQVQNATISANEAKTSGGGIYTKGTITITGTSSFTKNHAATHGGAVYVNGTDSGASFSITGGTIGGSTANKNYVTGGDGGGIYVTGSSATVSVSGGEISYNTTATSSTDYTGGGLHVESATSISLTGAAKLNYNEAGTGGGAYINSGALTINGTNAELSHNKALASGGDGGGIFVNSGNVDLQGTITAEGNNAVDDGGGFYVNNGSLTISSSGVTITENTSGYWGGGICVASGGVSMSGGTISKNEATYEGGGIRINSGSFTMTGGTIGGSSRADGNTVTNGNGGGVATAYSSATVSVASGEISGNTASNFGGGVYMAGGQFDLYSGSYIHGNSAVNGGGVYMTSGSFNHHAGEIGKNYNFPNEATNGAGVYMASGTYTMDGGYINGNMATGNGGGVFMSGGNFYLQGGNVGWSSDNYKNTAANGGGLYMESGGNFHMTSGSIVRNEITGNGGGVYISDGTFNMSGGTIGGSASAANKTTGSNGNGGGVYITGTGSSVDISGGAISYNESAGNGGGIFINNGTMTFSDGSISYNMANTFGGGVYMAEEGTLNLNGQALLEQNHVPAGQKGGGIYLAGVIIVGSTGGSQGNPTSDQLICETNYADVAGATITDANRNNIFLPNPVAYPVGSSERHVDVITVIPWGMATTSRVGFSVPRNFVPVIYSTSIPYLEYLLSAKASNIVFDDTHSYLALRVDDDPDIDPNHIYLLGYWPDVVSSAPEDFDPMDINTPQKFAWFINYVNGTHGGAGVASANGKLTADLDMAAYSWVGIGSDTKKYTGTFDGNGHVITGLNMYHYDDNSDNNYGLFANLNGGTVKNVYIRDGVYNISKSGETFYIGALAGQQTGGTVENSMVTGELIANNNSSIVGGLVGKQSGGEIHTSYIAAEMKGYTMGGLVGQHTGGNLFNSFANPQFSYKGTDNSYFIGGLVAENSGVVENCYVRLERTQTLGNAKFGMLAGTNTGSGSIVQCYAPDGDASQFNHSYTYLYNNATTGLGHCDLYKKAEAPYLYNRPNDNMVGNTGEVLYKLLNEWVSAQGTNSGYSYWKRTTAGGYATSAHAGNINDDYPIHKMIGSCCAASPDGLFIQYKPSLNQMITDYNTLGGGTLWLYDSPKTTSNTDEYVNVSNADAVKLYIDEDATLLQANNNELNAFTSQTLGDFTAPSRGERWHYCSSSLQESTIGFSYGSDNVAFSWASNPCNMSFSTANDAALFPGDLTATNITSIDLYCFYEPEYHWVNLKRNSNSHWHMDAPTVQILYNGNGTGGNGNETYLVPGKGYLMSIDKEQLLQNWGTLNCNDVTLQDVTYTEYNEWAGLLGYNLLGNPYQAYLDFNQFIGTNTQLFATKNAAEMTFAIYDPKFDAYVQYKSGSSKGSKSSDGLIHAHQGFLIKRTGGAASTNAVFSQGMCTTAGTSSFRDERPAFPLINLTLTDGAGNGDIAVLEFGRERNEGVEKLRVGGCNARISLALDHEEYAILFREEMEDYQALHLKAEKADTFTLEWEPINGVFENLTLVDNITGVQIDMLANNNYVFEADPEQYESRFKIVFRCKLQPEEPEEPETDVQFAFLMGDELIVNGEGTLQLFDVTGRLLMQREIVGTQSAIGKPEITVGVYLLRLTSKSGTKTQKIIID